MTLKTSQPVPRFASPVPAPLRKGDTFEWQVNRSNGTVVVDAEVRHISEHAYWVFEADLSPDQGRLEQAAMQFESDVWAGVINPLGDVWNPGIDNDPRIVIFHGRLRPGVAGYFSGADEYPVQIQADSNQREAIYISSDGLTLGGNGYMSTIAHELQHAIHWAADAGEESWVNEGISEVASGLAGFPPGSISSFLRRPNTSLVQWEPEIFEASPNYGAAALFFEYIAAQYGGVETLRAIIEHPSDGIESIDAVMAELGLARNTVDLFSDWVVANYVDDESGVFGYPDRRVNRPRSTAVLGSQVLTGKVRPFGTNYYEIRESGKETTISFKGSPEGQVFPAEPHSGETCWWSNAGDSIDTTLTRTVDLRSVNSARFEFWAWYAIEEDWDYVYIEVSTDGGSTWQVLPSDRSSAANPNGTAFGPGLTGQSNGWVKDGVDLTQYAGDEVLLRIEYITDDAIHDRGACFDDFSIAELDFSDSTDGEGGWTSNGFALISDRRAVEYLLQVIHDTVNGPAVVERALVGRNGIADVTVRGPENGELIAVAVSVVTPDVTGSLDYEISFVSR